MRPFKRLSEKILFSDFTPLVQLGSTRPLQPQDMPALPEQLDPRTVVLDESVIDWSGGMKMLRTLQRASRKIWLPQLSFYALFALMNLLGPVLVNLFVSRISGGLGTREAVIEGVLYGLGVGMVGLVGGLSLQHYFLRHLGRHQIITNVVNKKIFSHSLRLTKEARERTPVGDIVNHMSTDTDAVAEVGNALADMLYCLVMILGAVGLLFYYLGPTAWVAVVLLSVLAPLTRKVARDFTRFDKDLMDWRDKRVTLMAQILSAVRLVKYFVWEKSVSDEVALIRSGELGSRRRIARAELLVTLLYISVGTFVLFAVLGVYAYRGGVLDAALIFTCVSLFSLLEDPFAFISRSVSQFISGKVGAERIAKFLNEPVLPEGGLLEVAVSGPAGFAMENLTVLLGEKRHPALKDVTLNVKAGESLAVVGSVGAGKSSFIQALLGEVETEGHINFVGAGGESLPSARIGYVPQEAYVLNGTLRDNLTFGREGVSDAEIARAVEVCALTRDLSLIPGGLRAEIGEKGINLSGGQRQRLSLARAVIHRPQLVIMDDPLSAVDTHTEDHLVRELLFGEWKNITRVMITHRLTHLREFDQIAFLDHGQLVGLGTFEQLQAECALFRAYLEEYGRSHSGLAHEKETAQVSQANGDALRVTEEEDREYGAVRGGMYWDYVKALGGDNRLWRPVIIVSLILAASSNTALPLLQKGWLAFVSNNINSTEASKSWLASLASQPLSAIYVYGGIGLLVLIGTMCADLFWLKRGLAAGRSVHDRMLKSILGAGTRFFDSTPVGRVLQRFSRDMEAVDIHLQWSFEHSMKCFAQVILTLVLIVVALPAVIIPLVPILFVYYRTQKLYRASAREAKRLDSISRSPRYAHFKETLTGLVVIRAFGKSEWFMNEFYNRLGYHQRMFYGHYMINRWFSSRIPIIGGFVAMATTLMIVYAVHSASITPGMAGLLTVYSLSFWGVLNWGIRIWSEVEARMTSMERIKFYSSLPQEQSTVVEAAVPEVWPTAGEVRFENVTARYAAHMPLVLKGLSFSARAGTRVGIVGRTGSGKSTVFQALYRFIEVAGGRITIDGVNIAGVPLHRLRRALAIIPQDPTLFMGSLRSNLDRYGEHSDEELWRVLDRTSLGLFVRSLPQGLQTELVENGVNLSQGQRQLLCLARALLMKAKVIILDEATASVDVKTDATVQRVLRESCKGVTMLIIAHRLGTVRDCDQILEIRDGVVVDAFQGMSVSNGAAVSAAAPAFIGTEAWN
jgi:ABC-type multidrug transport system fused ATPase/permease subunit